ncbi:MAG: alpha/beta fold hydrolase [Endomicrobiales bacterium]|nr:alpha/beta fold hydrolase [Endomicrobiales bacterium]
MNSGIKLGAMIFLLSAYLFSQAGAESVVIQTNDNVLLQADFQPPSPGKTTFVFLHGLGSNRQEWTGFVKFLTSRGFGSLAYDARGHGDSVLDSAGRRRTYQEFGRPYPGSEWSKMRDDLDKVVNHLTVNLGISRDKVGLFGASLGANISLTYAAENGFTGPLVLLSPGIEYAGYDIRRSITKIKRETPTLVVSSYADGYSYQSCEHIALQLKSRKSFKSIFVSSGHGVQMLDDDLQSQIFDWIKGR